MITVRNGDALEVLRTLDSASAHAMVTDPPAGISFMGKAWDGDRGGREKWIAWLAEIFREARRVLKPGAHALVWALPRTSHWTATALEDAGFEVRDVIVHLFGTGFPKSARVNRDPRFCQCAEAVRNGGRTDLEPPRAGRMRTAAAVVDGAPPLACAPHSIGAPADFECGYPPDRRCDGAPPRLAAEVDAARAQRPECAQARSHSAEPVGAPGAAPAHSPSPARCSGRPASMDSQSHGAPPASPGSDSSTPPSPEIGSDSASLDLRTHRTDASVSACGLPLCVYCGNPDSNGWGTALKPAAEHWILARVPLAGSVAANVLEHGTGAINIDGCRIGDEMRFNPPTHKGATPSMGSFAGCDGQGSVVSGRWPANVVLSGDAPALLDAQSGFSISPGQTSRGAQRGHSGLASLGPQGSVPCPSDSGGASRFFYCAKPARSEKGEDNDHPTAKSIELMRWLVRLVTPRGGLVLDPFAGSGTTGLACIAEGEFDALLIEQHGNYAEIATKRAQRESPLFHNVPVKPAPKIGGE